MQLPVTRYYGSKRKVVERIWNVLTERQIEYNSVLDLFGGTGIVSYFMASKDKEVIYNDLMQFNCMIARALLQSPKGILTEERMLGLLQENPQINYRNYIEEIYRDIYYLDEENHQIDIVAQNIMHLPLELQPSAYYVFFQSCMIKRPFNIFHRKNLSLRTNFTTARFGNKKTWEIPFEELFVRFTRELNKFQFQQLPQVQIDNASALNLNRYADLVYIDTPYFTNRGTNVSYHARYHFLEGLVNYELIPEYISRTKNNLELTLHQCDEFEQKATFVHNLDTLLAMHEQSVIALSYTSNGYPSIEELVEILNVHKTHVEAVSLGKHPFALNHNNADREEVLIIGY